MPRRHRTRSKTSPDRIQAALRSKQALELRLAGADFETIAQQLGYRDRSGAYRAVMAALARLPEPEVVQYRRINLERLNRARMAITPAVRKGDVRAIGAEINIQEREARYLGLDAPTRQEVTGAGGGPLLTQIIVSDQETKAGVEGVLRGERTEPTKPAGAGDDLNPKSPLAEERKP